MSVATQRDDRSSVHPHFTGLTATEVEERIARGETNAFEPHVGRTYWEILRYNILNVFNIVLFILLLIVLLSRDYITVLFAGFSVVGNSLIGTVQEIHAKRKLDRLAHLATREVQVWREGELVTIDHQNIVKDDVIAIKPGDRLVADGTVLHSDSLEIDESHLTGESDAVFKAEDDPVYSGSFCLAGAGVMVATRVGRHSTANRLAAIAKVYRSIMTPTQQKIATIVKWTMLVMAIFAPMIVISGFVTGIGFIEITKNLVVFVTSLVPQGLILVTILSLTIGAVRISRHETLIQRVNAVESLANVTVLCFDKTGTITHNRLAVSEILPLDSDPPEALIDTLRTYLGNLSHQNSTAAAIARYVYGDSAPNGLPPKVDEIPFTSARKWGAVILEDETLILGAPERVLGPDHDFAEMIDERSQRGLRVLAFACSDSPPSRDARILEDTRPIALIAVSDQIRDDIRDTLDAFREQNVQLKVISGDNLRTVTAIAAQAGIPTEHVYTGDELDAMSDAQLEQTVSEANIFARIEPETKQRIVTALQRQGNHVAMVGDGVNDVPALKTADLAIVMNDGAQISKDVADIVLLNNAMSTLPPAFAEGTETTQTIFGTTKMFLAKNGYQTLLFIFALFMSLPFPISPIQISWSAFGTVNMPAALVAIGFLRPRFISRFRHDVLDYIITAALVGAAHMALLYVVVYFYAGPEVARHAMTVIFITYGLMIAWNVHGVDLLRPRTILQHPRVVLASGALTVLTLTVATLEPAIFEFRWPPLEIMVLVVAIQCLAGMIVAWGMHHRGLLYQFYDLVERK